MTYSLLPTADVRVSLCGSSIEACGDLCSWDVELLLRTIRACRQIDLIEVEGDVRGTRR